jgi:hypothetical protein
LRVIIIADITRKKGLSQAEKGESSLEHGDGATPCCWFPSAVILRAMY